MKNASILLLFLLSFTACQNPTSVVVSPTTNEQQTPEKEPVATPIDTKNRGEKLFTITGAEPFWSMEIASKTVLFRSLAKGDTLYFNYAPPISASGRTAEYIRFYEFKNDDQKVLVSMRKRDTCKCSDGMSDNEYPYEALLYFSNGEGYEGCVH